MEDLESAERGRVRMVGQGSGEVAGRPWVALEEKIIVEIKIKTKSSLTTTNESEKISSSHSNSARTTLMQHNDPWSLYAQTAVRLKYYASDKYSESYELASFIKDGRITFLSPFY